MLWVRMAIRKWVSCIIIYRQIWWFHLRHHLMWMSLIVYHLEVVPLISLQFRVPIGYHHELFNIQMVVGILIRKGSHCIQTFIWLVIHKRLFTNFHKNKKGVRISHICIDWRWNETLCHVILWLCRPSLVCHFPSNWITELFTFKCRDMIFKISINGKLELLTLSKKLTSYPLDGSYERGRTKLYFKTIFNDQMIMCWL